MIGKTLGTVRGTRYSMSYERVGAVGEDRFKAADIGLAKRVGDALIAAYPGHMWMVNADHRQGIVQIRMPVLMGHWSYVLKIRDLKGDPTLRAVARAGGEILERYRIPRSGLDMDLFRAVLARQPMVLTRATPVPV